MYLQSRNAAQDDGDSSDGGSSTSEERNAALYVTNTLLPLATLAPSCHARTLTYLVSRVSSLLQELWPCTSTHTSPG